MMLKTIFSVALLAGIAALAWERSALVNLRQRNKSFGAAKEESDRLQTENLELPKLRSAAAIVPASRSETSELLRLRNEVGLLRSQTQETEKLRAENQRLAAEIKSDSFARPKLSEMEGYLPKETWAGAGFKTPEAAIQMFFSAIQEWNAQRVLECFPPTIKDALGLINLETGELSGDTTPDLRRKTAVNGFRIAERNVLSQDKIVLGIQASIGGIVEKFTLGRVGQEWKITEY